MYICVCNALNEKDLKKACKNLCSIDGEAVLKGAGCKAQCGNCLDYIESFITPDSSALTSASSPMA